MIGQGGEWCLIISVDLFSDRTLDDDDDATGKFLWYKIFVTFILIILIILNTNYEKNSKSMVFK